MEMDFEGFDPMVAGLALGAGILSVVVMSGTNPSIFLQVVGFVATTILAYFVVGRIKG